MQIIFSSTKSFAALALNMAIDRSATASHEDLVTAYWPEFGQNGKEHLTIADVMRHDAGLPYIREHPITEEEVEDQRPDGALARLFETAPMVSSKRLYHGLTRGWIINQLLIRIDPKGRSVGRFIREEIAGPLGADFHVGMDEVLQARLEREERLVDLHESLHPQPMEYCFAMDKLPGLLKEVVAGVPDTPIPRGPDDIGFFSTREDGSRSADNFQTRRGRAMEFGSANGHASARGIARIMSVLANGGTSTDGVTLLSPKGLAEALKHPVLKPMFGLGDTAFVQGGWNAHCVSGFGGMPMKLNEKIYGRSGSYGWAGWGGSLAYFNPELDLAVGWTITGMAMSTTSGDKRSIRLQLAVMQAIEAAADGPLDHARERRARL
jgi:CubicO group peptidase (beta-lactamase class C family)